jgi:erythromycin esterase-like protein
VLLGEASHGTSEFYQARAAITRRLIEAHGFSIVAVEADWPDAAAIDRYVRHRPARPELGHAFERSPTWMWRNTNVDAFVVWLRQHNESLDPDARADSTGSTSTTCADRSRPCWSTWIESTRRRLQRGASAARHRLPVHR